jgi:hypothetical protein
MSAIIAATLAACGGGGGDGGGGSTASAPAAQITGTAATGAALANATVAITNTAGTSPCVETTLTTSQLGSYTCTLKSGETAPFFIVVTDPTGNTAPLVSIATTTPLSGTPLLVNATPLTTAIVAQLNGGDALGVVSNKALYVPATFELAKAHVIAQIQDVVSNIDPTLSHYDPFSTSITAANAGTTGNTADQILDVIKITKTASGALALATISDPTPIAVATATSQGTVVAKPTTSVSDLSQAAQLAAQALNACYAQPVSQRVTKDANGNITEVSGPCQSIVTSTNVPTGAAAFKSNGYNAIQTFYGLLNSDAMTGAKFSVPEIMAFYAGDTTTGTRDKAVINIRYIDNVGNPGNLITVAQSFPGTSTTSRPSTWWITGNQWSYDLGIKTSVRRAKEYYPGNPSRFQNGMDIYINGANVGNASAPNSSLYDSVRVTGDGLPTAGLWYVRSAVSGQFAITTMRSTTPPTTATLSQAMVCADCSSFWISRTKDVAGANASVLDTNPTSAPYKFQWGSATDGSYNGVTGVRPTKGKVYVFDIYNNGTKVVTEKRTLLTDLVAADQAINMQWNDIGPQSTSAMDVKNTLLNGVQSTLAVDWIQNPSAEQIKYVWVSQTNGGYDNGTKILAGATSVIATPYTGDSTTTQFTGMTGTPSYNATPFGGYREIGFNYRMLDGSAKNAVYSYFP